MNTTISPLTTVGRRFLNLLSAASSVRYGVAAIIVGTVGYASISIIPMIRRDLGLLQRVYTVDEQGISLEGELQFEIQESRRAFLRVLLGAGDGVATAKDLEAMHAADAVVPATEAKLAALKVAPGNNEAEFQQRWQNYLKVRDGLLAPPVNGNSYAAWRIDPNLGNGAFAEVEDSVRDAAKAYQQASGQHVTEVSRTLNRALEELLAMILVKALALGLLIWMDWRRVRAEQQLLRATRELQASEDRFRQAYDLATVGMRLVRLDGTILSSNRVAAGMLGYEIEELVGMNVNDILAPEWHESSKRRHHAASSGEEKSFQVERRLIRKDGRSIWLRNSVTLLESPDEETLFFVLSEEITDQKEAHDRLAYLANFDPVTNLPNRYFFEQQLAERLVVMGRGDAVALLYAELDSFDFLKGTFGQTVADEVLAEVGAALESFRKEGELVARLDDHVFAMLVKAIPYDQATLDRGGELREVFHQASEQGKHRIPLSASIGIAYSSDDAWRASGNRSSPSDKSGTGARGTAGLEGEKLIKFARAAMLEARLRGGDAIYLADPGLQERAAQRHQIESALLTGLRENEFRVVFQPQFQVATGQLIRFEALCRWTSRELGPIPPDRFIPIAEQTGLIMEIGKRVMTDALLQAKSWTDSGRRIGVAVNISPMQFMRPDFTHIVTEVLAKSNFPPALLELEITEGIFIRDLNLAVARIRELQRLGLSIALDDFGTGYSSLSYLQRMPIDAVKLDRSFVNDLTTNTATVSMVRSVLSMAGALNLRVVTEGVETAEQLEILRELGCDEAQGYLLGRPESAEMALQRVLNSPLLPIGTAVLSQRR